MLKPKITLKDIKHHFNYMGWLYLLLPVVMILAWSLLYALTEYRPPDDKVLSFYMVGQYVDVDTFDATREEIRPFFPEMEDLDFLPVPVNNVYDSANWQRLFTYIYAQQGDVMLIDAEIFDAFCGEGMFMPLEEYLSPSDIDLTYTTRTTTDVPEEHLYGIPADGLYGLWAIDKYDMRRSVFVVMAYSDNLPEGTQLIQWYLDNRAAPEPVGFADWPAKEPFYPEEPPEAGASMDMGMGMW